MSFGFTYYGTPDGIKKKLDEQSAQLTGNSKDEFEAVKPAILAVIDQNVGERVVLKVVANGHASFENGAKKYGNANVEVARFGELAI